VTYLYQSESLAAAVSTFQLSELESLAGLGVTCNFVTIFMILIV
jgi:hypothetical protein